MSGWIREGAFIYKLNANGNNEWSMQVQPGRDDDDVRTHQYTLENVARMAHAAPDMYESAIFARAVLGGILSAGHNVPSPTPEDIEKAFWQLDAALSKAEGQSPQSTDGEAGE